MFADDTNLFFFGGGDQNINKSFNSKGNKVQKIAT